MEPHLSHYTIFYIVVKSLLNDGQIDQQQNDLLKQHCQNKDQGLMSIILNLAQKGKEQYLKQSLISFVRDKIQEQMPKVVKLALGKYSVSAKHISVNNNNRQEREINQNVQEIFKKQPTSIHIESMTRQLEEILKEDLSLSDQRKIMLMRDRLNEYLGFYTVQEEAQSPNIISNNFKISGQEDLDKEQNSSLIMKTQYHSLIINNIKTIYRQLKHVFSGSLHTHLLLMQEDISYNNLFQVMKSMIKTLTDSDNILFFTKKGDNIDFYTTEMNQIQNLKEDGRKQFLKAFQSSKPNHIYNFKENDSQLDVIFDIVENQTKYGEISLIRFLQLEKNQEIYFFFLWKKEKTFKLQRNFINHANEYGFKDEVLGLSNFLVEVIMQARVQFFTPLQFSDQLQDIALSFVGISRFLLVDGIKKALEVQYRVSKEQAFSEEGFDRVRESNQVLIEMECRNPITLVVFDMDLNNEQDQLVYAFIIKIQAKFQQYLRLCHEKTAYYKYFIRSTDSLVFDFDRSGRLLFLSHPIWPQLSENYKISYQPENKYQTYDEIFIDERISKLIDLDEFMKKKKNQYIQNDQFEIFLKVVDQRFKGFVLIFHIQETRRVKQYIKNLKNDEELEKEIKKSIQRSFNKHQTFKFLNQLEQKNPGVKNSMISLYIPEDSTNTNFEYQGGGNLRPRVSISLVSNKIRQFNPPSISLGRRIQSIEAANEEDEDDEFIESMILDDSVSKFDFNIFNYENKMKFKIAYHILDMNDWINVYNIPKDVLVRFIKELERKYNKFNNPFHNFDHGVSVMQCCNFLGNQPTCNLLLNDLSHFSTVISGLCHDVSHTGRTNPFEISSRSKLAIRYLDRSPLEQHHASKTLKLLKDDKYNILINFSKEDQVVFRQILIDNILYTDIKQHFGLMKDFESRWKDSQENVERYFGSAEGDHKLLMGVIIHTADFNGGAKPFEISRIWSDRVNSEFKCQYQEEGQKNLPQTPFLKDLDNVVVMAKSEMGFFKVIVRPLWALLNDFCNNDMIDIVKNLDNTIINWEKIYNEQQKSLGNIN